MLLKALQPRGGMGMTRPLGVISKKYVLRNIYFLHFKRSKIDIKNFGPT